MLPSKRTARLLYLFKIRNHERLNVKSRLLGQTQEIITKSKRVEGPSFLPVSIFSSFWALRVHRCLGPKGDASSWRITMGRKYALKLRFLSWIIFFSKKMNAFTKRRHEFREGPRTLSASHSTFLLISGEANPLPALFSTVLCKLLPLNVGVLSDASYCAEGILPYSSYL